MSTFRLQDHRSSCESNASLVTYINDKRRTSTLLLKPISNSKPSQHPSSKRKYFFFEEEKRVVVANAKSREKPSGHRLQVEQMRRELVQALQNIRYIAAHCEQESLIESVRDEWKFIATVIDRLQFVIFLTVTICGSVALLSEVRLFDYKHSFIYLISFSSRDRMSFGLVRTTRRNSSDFLILI